MSFLFDSTERERDLGLLVLRLVVGIVFIVHGGQKLFVFGIPGVQASFTKIGAPFPMVTGPLIGGLEFFGGIALVLGLLTRLVTLGLAADMLGAIILVHGKNGFFLPKGYEFVLILMGASIALLLSGPGNLSADAILSRRHHSS
jgi:putative oxidoreductase